MSRKAKEGVCEWGREREREIEWQKSWNIFSEIIKNRFRHTNKWIKYNWATNTMYTVSCNAKKVILKLKTPLDHLTIKKNAKKKLQTSIYSNLIALSSYLSQYIYEEKDKSNYTKIEITITPWDTQIFIDMCIFFWISTDPTIFFPDIYIYIATKCILTFQQDFFYLAHKKSNKITFYLWE